jgi:hypothetical protein
VDAVELLEGDAPFIVDTSAWWRFSSLPSELVEEAIVDDRLGSPRSHEWRVLGRPLSPESGSAQSHRVSSQRN